MVRGEYREDKARPARLQKHRQFSVTFNAIDFGPAKRPRLIWATGEATREILELQEHVESALGAHDDGKFLLHMTLARFRPEEFRAFPVKRIGEKVEWQMSVESIVLMESHLSSAGADYEVLEEIKFRES
jgi:2'-5' RNA ligase